MDRFSGRTELALNIAENKRYIKTDANNPDPEQLTNLLGAIHYSQGEYAQAEAVF